MVIVVLVALIGCALAQPGGQSGGQSGGQGGFSGSQPPCGPPPSKSRPFLYL